MKRYLSGCGGAGLSQDETRDELETDPRFPTGRWIGFWIQSIPAWGKQWMELRLTFARGVLTGEGRDIIGSFSFRGRYLVDDGVCYWTKTYHGQHDVAYSGFNEGKGIWGKWEIPATPPTSVRLHGGFHIWPEGMRNPSENELSAAADLPLEETFSPRRIVEPVGSE
jgi:hypothetical protein